MSAINNISGNSSIMSNMASALSQVDHMDTTSFLNQLTAAVKKPRGTSKNKIPSEVALTPIQSAPGFTPQITNNYPNQTGRA